MKWKEIELLLHWCKNGHQTLSLVVLDVKVWFLFQYELEIFVEYLFYFVDSTYIILYLLAVYLAKINFCKFTLEGEGGFWVVRHTSLMKTRRTKLSFKYSVIENKLNVKLLCLKNTQPKIEMKPLWIICTWLPLCIYDHEKTWSWSFLLQAQQEDCLPNPAPAPSKLCRYS